MIRFVATITLLTALLGCAISVASAQDYPVDPNPRPMFAAGRRPATTAAVPAKQLVQWNGSFTDLTHRKITFTMVGTDPSKTNVTTTFQVWVVPIKMVFDKNHGNKIFDPKTKLSNGRTVIQNILKSPVFQSGIDFKQGPTDLGKTQYLDAFQRGTWWGKNVKKNNKYHVLLKPVMKPEQTIKCTDPSCAVRFEGGVLAGLADINYYDNQVQGFLAKLGATPDILPLFIFYDTYLTQNGGQCCVGGYHFANGGQPSGQTYSNSTYIDKLNVFGQDVSAISHELGEWMDDPFVDNRVNCNDNSILEVGDPLEGGFNFGGFKYKLNLQSLVFVGYFGAPTSDSANKWLSFQNDEKHVCPGQ